MFEGINSYLDWYYWKAGSRTNLSPGDDWNFLPDYKPGESVYESENHPGQNNLSQNSDLTGPEILPGNPSSPLGPDYEGTYEPPEYLGGEFFGTPGRRTNSSDSFDFDTLIDDSLEQEFEKIWKEKIKNLPREPEPPQPPPSQLDPGQTDFIEMTDPFNPRATIKIPIPKASWQNNPIPPIPDYGGAGLASSAASSSAFAAFDELQNGGLGMLAGSGNATPTAALDGAPQSRNLAQGAGILNSQDQSTDHKNPECEIS